MLHLCRHRWNMALSIPRLFFRGRPRWQAAFSPVVTNSVHRCLVDHRCVVNVMNHSDVYITRIAIVEKLPALPASTFETNPEEAEAIVNSPVKAHMRTPVTLMP